MSDALTYLVKARPDAVGHYLAFLKDCGTRLDPKTRNLISVITKVHAQTERGLRQYLKRALRDGCTAEEVIDALLMAFPALGLSKIVWATDVILAMNLPEFVALVQPEAKREPEWHDLGAEQEFDRGQTRRIECEGHAVFVHRAGDGWRVFDAQCPHEGNDLSELSLKGHTLTCSRHAWRFDARSGACTENGDRPLREWKCRIEKGRLQAHW